MFIAIILGMTVGIGLSVMAKTPTPDYKILDSQGKIELRQYDPMIMAEVSVSGDRDTAANRAFSLLFDFISGANTSQEKIAMTAPVVQKSEKIAMTAPVTQQKAGDGWTVAFIMPEKYTMETVPTPNSDKIRLYETEPQKQAAIQFSGFYTDNAFEKHHPKLLTYIENKGLSVVGEPVYAYYNSPFALPFLRRNEILYTVKEK